MVGCSPSATISLFLPQEDCPKLQFSATCSDTILKECSRRGILWGMLHARGRTAFPRARFGPMLLLNATSCIPRTPHFDTFVFFGMLFEYMGDASAADPKFKLCGSDASPRSPRVLLWGRCHLIMHVSFCNEGVSSSKLKLHFSLEICLVSMIKAYPSFFCTYSNILFRA